MDENQALLGKEYDIRHKQQRHRPYSSYQHDNLNDERGSSSDGSDGWWADSHSSCSSSCSGSGSESESESVSSNEWESEVNSNGELFFIQSNPFDLPEPSVVQVEPDACPAIDETSNKGNQEKPGKLSRWMRRRESKRLRPKLSILGQDTQPRTRVVPQNKIRLTDPTRGEIRHVVLRVETSGQGVNLCERLLGITTEIRLEQQSLFITGFISRGPADGHKDLSIGDRLESINQEVISPQNIERILGSVSLPTEVLLTIEKPHEFEDSDGRRRNQSAFVKSLVVKNTALETVLLGLPVGVVFVSIEGHNADKSDLIYSYPEKCTLEMSRGSFITLLHLMSDMSVGSNSLSSSVTMKGQVTHIVYTSDSSSLFLLALPQSRCSVREANLISSDVTRCLAFNYQSLHRCFTHNSRSDLDHFFSLFFSRILTSGYSPESSHRVMLESIAALSIEPSAPLFEDILPEPVWIPLPKEAQLQIDDALNELEANDFENLRDESIESQRLYTIVGSSLYHKGYLLATHLSKDDILDTHSFFRQNGLMQLFRNEPVKSLVIWREVFPLSVNRGLTTRKNPVYRTPTGRWFLMIIGRGYDALVVILEAGGCASKAVRQPGPGISYVEEAEDTLRHIQKLGISNLASQWIFENSRYKTITPDDIFCNKSNRKKENLLGFVRSADNTPRVQISGSSPSGKQSLESALVSRSKGSQSGLQNIGEVSEDSLSQATSNVSEISDENAPILGRRAERGKLAAHLSEESDNSDSDWESFRDSNRPESMSSSGIDASYSRGMYLGGVHDLIPSKLTTGTENALFHYVHLDGNEGVLTCPPINWELSSLKMKEIINKFRKSAQVIHSLLENNVRFKKNSNSENPKCLINKSLIAVKEHGILLECSTYESESNKKLTSFCYWVVGRLFFTPQPREVYVCYYDEAPQNLIEMAFRLGLAASG